MKRILLTISLITLSLAPCRAQLTGRGQRFKAESQGTTICYQAYTPDSAAVIARRGGYSGKVVIPDRVTHQGKSYLVGKINWNAFRNCEKLTSVSIPASVNTIDEWAFCGCSQLSSVTLASARTGVSGDCFPMCNRLKNITVAGKPVPVRLSEEMQFNIEEYGCEEDELIWNLPYLDDIFSIYDSENNCNLYFSVFDDYVQLCAGPKPYLAEVITVPANVTYRGRTYQVIGINAFAFKGSPNLTAVIVPNSAEMIGYEAFADCPKLTTVRIANAEVNITRNAFCGSTRLQKITVGGQPRPVHTDPDIPEEVPAGY